MRTNKLVVLASVTGASIAIGGVAALATLAQPGADRPSADARAPEIVAIIERADWCSLSPTMEPRIDEARKALADQPVLFLTADYTDERTSAQAEYLLGCLDAQQAWAEYGRLTGIVILLDPDTRAIVGTLTPDMSADQMVEAIRRAAGN